MKLRQTWRNRQGKDNIPKKWLQYESLRIKRGSKASLVEKNRLQKFFFHFSLPTTMHFNLNIFPIVEFPKDKISHQPVDS